MSENGNKILVALDGSERSLKTIEYLCDFKPFNKKEIVLFNVFNAVPDCYWDMGREPFSRNAMAQAKGWEFQRKREIEEFMERSKSMLVDAGYPRDAVSSQVQNRKKGVARDIIAEASKGYFALLARRRGYGALLHVVMGSTTTKLVEKLSSVPVLLAGIQKVNNSLFIAVDGSPGSQKAVDFAVSAVENSECRIVLCSVLRDLDLRDGSAESDSSSECVKSFFDIMETVIDEAAEKFEAAGIPGDRIERKIITGTKSRAGAIAQAAEEENCDTIVLGRRGKSNVEDFNIGRVPWKVIHAARKMTVWIVS